MPINSCSVKSKPGYKFGNNGKCYTYDPNNEKSKMAAKKAAIKQWIAAVGPEKFKQEVSKGSLKDDLEILMEIASNKNSTDEELYAILNGLNINIINQIGIVLKKNKKNV